MKFVKGMMIGGLITTGVIMMWIENEMTKKKITKKGKKLAKRIGIM